MNLKRVLIGTLSVTIVAGFLNAAIADARRDLPAIQARKDYATFVTEEAGPDAGIAFAALGTDATVWAISIFPDDHVTCDAAMDVTQADLGARLYLMGFRSVSCLNDDEYGWPISGSKRWLVAPKPPVAPFKPLHPWRRTEADA